MRTPRVVARPATLWSRPYRVPAAPFGVRTDDGVDLVGHRLGRGATALVFCHGFTGWHRKGKLVRFQEELARRFTVYAFDLRGHGDSGGVSSFGAAEDLDVQAVVCRAREDGFARVVTVGGSMGGIAVLRHAALAGGVDTVVAISTPARWSGHQSEAVRKMLWLTATRSGERILRAWGTRVTREWQRAEEPADLVERISPTPLVIVHGRDDHYFAEEEAWTLYRRAREPKRLLLATRFGHAEDGYTPAFARQLASLLGEGT
ncbi:MAG TPA: alpha/beta fold hydrolase [Actinomycetota bacterium]|nr:alpha/beta fold hydrolase [Actinomycetota bacterium]